MDLIIKIKPNLRSREAGEAVYNKKKIALSLPLLAKASRVLALPLIALVVLYQKTLSPDHGPWKKKYPYGYCKFHPTCSMYAKEVLKLQGIIGIPRIGFRLLRCNPFSLPKIDHP